MQSSWKALIVVYLGSSAFYLDIYHDNDDDACCADMW